MTGEALSRCPFLHHAQKSGATLLASLESVLGGTSGSGCPFSPARSGISLETATQLIHGPDGVVPLKRFGGDSSAPAQTHASECPLAGTVRRCPVAHGTRATAGDQHAAATIIVSAQADHVPQPSDGSNFLLHNGASDVSHTVGSPVGLGPGKPKLPSRPKGAAAPMASMSLAGFGFLPDPSEFFRGRRRRRKRPEQQRQTKQQRSQRPGGQAPTPEPHAAAMGQTSETGSRCPMRAFFGPLSALLPLSATGRLQCPPLIVQMRAAVAAMKPVRDLRPQALPVRSAALMAVAVAANVPCGAWREHTEKFSLQWFVAVHATIPFVAMLRKAVLMPQWALALTVAGAVAGQAVGARLERKRLAAHDRPGPVTCRALVGMPWESGPSPSSTITAC